MLMLNSNGNMIFQNVSFVASNRNVIPNLLINQLEDVWQTGFWTESWEENWLDLT